jgi:hypothetical protein
MPAFAAISLLIGQNPTTVPQKVVDAVQTIEVSQSDSGQSGFQISLQAPKDGNSTSGYGFVGDSLFRVFNRVIVEATIMGRSSILIDGVITHQQLRPGTRPEGSLFTITGEDLSVLMDLEEKVVQYPNQDEAAIVRTVLARYSQYGITPDVKAQPVSYTPDKNEYVSVQRGTDLGYVRSLAARFGYVFYVKAARQRQSNTAYWGPPVIDTTPQNAISLDIGPETNTGDDAWFEYNGLAATKTFGAVQDRITDVVSDVTAVSAKTFQGLSQEPALSSQKKVRDTISRTAEGRTAAEAAEWAQGMVDRSLHDVMTVRGKLDTTIYGAVLQSRQTVDLRGGSASYDGSYYVRSVVHKITKQDYWQEFVLVREGLKSTEATVRV